MRQLFNIREGINPKDFIMGNRMSGNPPLEHGPTKGRQIPIEKMVSMHWDEFGWDKETGIPTKETLASMGIEGGIG